MNRKEFIKLLGIGSMVTLAGLNGCGLREQGSGILRNDTVPSDKILFNN